MPGFVQLRRVLQDPLTKVLSHSKSDDNRLRRRQRAKGTEEVKRVKGMEEVSRVKACTCHKEPNSSQPAYNGCGTSSAEIINSGAQAKIATFSGENIRSRGGRAEVWG